MRERGVFVDDVSVHHWAIKVLLVFATARRPQERTINLHEVPEKITIDKSGANTAAIESVKANALTIWMNRITRPSSESLDRHLDSSHSAAPESSMRESKRCI